MGNQRQLRAISESVEAVDTLKDLLNSNNEKIRLAAASEILKHVPPVKIGSSDADEIRKDNTFTAMINAA